MARSLSFNLSENCFLTRIFISTLLLVAILSLGACGGGSNSNGSTPPPLPPPPSAPGAPPLTVTAAVKQLQFSWAAASGATYYRFYENVDGVSGFTQIGADLTTTAITRDIAVHLFDWVNARYRVAACNDLGCTDSSEVSATSAMLQAIGMLKASNAGAQDQFGVALAMSGDGNTLAVGARFESGNATGVNGDQQNETAPNSGAVYVFVRGNGAWTQQAYIKASNTDPNDYFGSSVALSGDGNTLAVGTPMEHSNATGLDGNQLDNSAPFAGAVYLFTRSNGTWAQQHYIKASHTELNQDFGYSVALSRDGNTLAVGARTESSGATGIGGDPADTSAPYAGAVFVFARDGDSWTQQAYIKASNTNSNDFFGFSVALSADGNTLAVGANLEMGGSPGVNGDQADNSVLQAGAVYVYIRSDGVWTHQAYIKASIPGKLDHFAFVTLSADGNTLAVGAPDEASIAMGINGDQTDDSAPSAGAVYVYTRSDNTWTQQAYIKASNAPFCGYFGMSVSLSADGNMLIVGADLEVSNAKGINGNQWDYSAPTAGAAYLFTRTSGTWVQKAYIKASNTKEDDAFGFSVAISDDGNTLAVGAFFENSFATKSGAVYVY